MASQPFSNLELILATDPANRGIGPLVREGTLEKAAKSLRTATKVAITTGFFIPLAGAYETDGPPGALCLAKGLRQLGCDVVFVADEPAAPLFRAAGLEPVIPFHDDLHLDDVSHLIAIERLGRAADGRYYNMRGIDVSSYTEPIDQLFLNKHPKQITIAIGDGGNEIGMGLVRDEVVKHIRFGERIASVVSTDNLLIAGVSNWGGYGLVAGLSILTNRNLMPTDDEAHADLAAVVAAGAVDGVTTEATVTVDGLKWSFHADILDRLRLVVRQQID